MPKIRFLGAHKAELVVNALKQQKLEDQAGQAKEEPEQQTLEIEEPQRRKRGRRVAPFGQAATQETATEV